jgi:hypothetical protein
MGVAVGVGAVGVAVGVEVGKTGKTAWGSVPGGTMITPGRSGPGGVTMICVCGWSGVGLGVKVAISTGSVGTGVGVARSRCTKSAAEHANVSRTKTVRGMSSRRRRVDKRDGRGEVVGDVKVLASTQ